MTGHGDHLHGAVYIDASCTDTDLISCFGMWVNWAFASAAICEEKSTKKPHLSLTGAHCDMGTFGCCFLLQLGSLEEA